MTWQHTIFVYPTLLGTVVSLVLGIYTLRYVQKHGPTAILTTFLFVNVGLVLWTGFSALKLLQTDPGLKLTMYRLLYLGVGSLGPFTLLFALAYTDREQWLRPRVVAPLFVVPAVYLVVLFTNPADLAIAGTRTVETGGVVVLRVDVGPAHVLLSLLYNAVLTLLAIGLVGYEAVRLGRLYLPQAVLMGVGIAAPYLFVLLSVAGVPPFDPDGVNLIPTAAAVSSLALGVALFRYKLLDLPPIAYTTAMEQSPDGVLVIDPDGWIVHANERATALLDGRGAAIGESIGDVLPSVELTGSGTDTLEMTADDETRRFLSARTQPLWRGDRTIGWVLVLRDVTELQRQKETIEKQREDLKLLNQIVRHDIRNDLQIVLAYVDLIADQSDDVEPEYVETALENARHAVELTETAREVTDTVLTEETTHEPVPLRDVLVGGLGEIRSAHPDAEITVDGEIPAVSVVADEVLDSVFRNLIQNAIQHNDAELPAVTVAVTEEDRTVTVRVADNGPGIPDDRKDDIFGRGEKGLESSGTGIGLYLVETLVESYGGEVWIEDNEPTGSVFVVRLRTT